MRNLTKTLAGDVIELGGIALYWWETVGKERGPQDIVDMRIGQIKEQISRARSVFSNKGNSNG